MCKKKRTGENGIKFNDKGEKSMKDTNSTTENITTKEENVMNEELLKIKEQLIDDIKSWYEDSYMIIRDMEQSNYEKPWIISEARKLTANARGGDDKRDANCTAIMEGIIRYIEAQPEEFFENVEIPWNWDDMVELLYHKFYSNADFELIEFSSRKEEFIEWLSKCADIDMLEFGNEVESEEKLELKDELLDAYENEEEEYFKKAWYDEWICVDELYDHVNEDIYRFGLYKG
ncbi:hypothetical protein [Blautia obeum]|uniref:hypothetical protein n=1 Tax=Blautia obeum TaxID=40520 RepID=UPI00398454F6